MVELEPNLKMKIMIFKNFSGGCAKNKKIVKKCSSATHLMTNLAYF